MEIDRAGLAAFLRRRRESLQPEDVGLPRGQRRRTERAAARGGRRPVPHVDRLLRAARAGARPAALRADDRLDRPGAAPLARRARPPVPARRAAPAGPGCGQRAHQPRPAARSSTGSPTPRRRSSPSSARRCARPRSGSPSPATRPATPGPARSRGYRWFTDPATRQLYAPEDHPLPLPDVRLRAARARHPARARAPGPRTSPTCSSPQSEEFRSAVGRARDRHPARRPQAPRPPRGRRAGAALPDAARPASSRTCCSSTPPSRAARATTSCSCSRSSGRRPSVRGRRTTP